MFRSSLIIQSKVADGRPTPFRLALVPAGCSASCTLTASILASDLPVQRLPEFPLFRFKVVPWAENFLTFAQIVLSTGGRRSGKRSANLSRVTFKLPVSKKFLTKNVLCSTVPRLHVFKDWELIICACG